MPVRVIGVAAVGRRKQETREQGAARKCTMWLRSAVREQEMEEGKAGHWPSRGTLPPYTIPRNEPSPSSPTDTVTATVTLASFCF